MLPSSVGPGALTVVVGEHQQLQPHQHLSQVIVAATVLPGSMGHKDEGPAGGERPVRKVADH